MSGFFGAFWEALRGLPRNLRRGLHPGEESPDPNRRLRRNFLFHIHPLKVNERSLHPLVTLGLGIMTLTLFLVLAVTGVLLMLYYVPTTREAHASMLDIQHAVAFGPFVRALHRWGAHAMVVTAALHLLRVAAMGAYRRRELNWIFGVTLLLLTLGLSFTGYLLPWDQTSTWAVTVASGMLDHAPGIGPPLKDLLLGGEGVGQATLTRFYTLHVALLPAGLALLLMLHLWRIRKDGGLAVPAGGPPSPGVPAWPALVLREAILAIGVVAALSLVATLVDAPLGAAPDLHRPDNPEKAPWYFLWLQEMVSHSATAGGFWFPAVLALGLVAVPFLDRGDQGIGVWFGGRTGRWLALICVVGAGGALVLFEALAIRNPGGVSDACNPATGMLLLAGLGCVLAGWITRSTRFAFLTLLLVLLVAIVGFTLVGVCRGPNWVFYWPWEEWPLVS